MNQLPPLNPDPFACIAPALRPWLLSALRRQPPSAFASLWRYAGKAWPRDRLALLLLGLSGWSTRQALNQALCALDPTLNHPQNPAIKRLWPRLQQRGLLHRHRLPQLQRPPLHVTLIELSDDGRRLLRDLGAGCLVLSEWQRLRLAHQADAQPRHSAMAILAAHLLRQRGFLTLLCPPLPGAFAPDLLLANPRQGLHFYVEIEAPDHGGRAKGRRLRAKWQAMTAAQGFVAFVALNPALRGQRLRSARQIAAHGFATDLVTLTRSPDVLWARSWGAPPLAADRSSTLEGGGP